MSSGSLDTFTKFQALLRNMSATELSNLFQAFGFEYVTTQWISRANKAGKFSLDIDQKLRPLVVRVENVIERAQPFCLSFNDVEHIRLLISIINHGVDVKVEVVDLAQNEPTESEK